MRSLLFVSILLAACAGSHEAQRSTTAAATPRPPELDNSAVENAMQRVRPMVSACVAGAHAHETWNVRLTVRGDGHVTEVHADSEQPDPQVSACLEGAISAATFPQFNGPPATFTVPYMIY
jgi:hypothetical protein